MPCVNDMASRSPVSVLDLSTGEGMRDVSEKTLLPPPLQLSPAALIKFLSPNASAGTCSTTDDETDSLSTWSSSSAESERARGCDPKRSIFPRYWQESGESPMALRRASSADSAPSVGSQPMVAAMAAKRSSLNSPGRRSILSRGCSAYASAPSLPTCDQGMSQRRALPRKALSSGELRARSCLRETRFSGPKRRSSVREEPISVTFDTKVDVHHFAPPIEMWSSSDWSRHFAT